MTPTNRLGQRKRGTILILTLVISLVVVLALAAAVMTTNSAARHSQFTLDHTAAMSVAEGVTDAAQKQMLKQVAGFTTPTLYGTVAIGGASYPFNITAIGTSSNRTNADGIAMAIQKYRITATATVGKATATIDRLVDLSAAPLFQYMIFFNDDLEVLPGPMMELGGKIHSNKDIYLGSGNILTLTTEYLRSTGNIYRKRKDTGVDTGGTVKIKITLGGFDNMDVDEDSENADWANLAITKWNGTVQTGVHGVKEVVSPDIERIGAFDPDTGEKGYFHKNADLVIKDNQAYDKNGNLLALPANTVVEKTMYDAREGKNIKVTEINMGLLNTSGYFPANGLLYAYRTDASSTQPNGIRLTNGTEILRSLNVVTEDPIYVHGDYNTQNKKGAAVIADAVNFLSKAWNDTKVAGVLPNAATTMYNVAIVTGNIPTPDGGGTYSGGFENLVRFHENWTSKTAMMRGAFIKIFTSQIAKAPWAGGGDRYVAPVRDWNYDPLLSDINNMPPYTPNAVFFDRVLWNDGLASPLPNDP